MKTISLLKGDIPTLYIDVDFEFLVLLTYILSFLNCQTTVVILSWNQTLQTLQSDQKLVQDGTRKMI